MSPFRLLAVAALACATPLAAQNQAAPTEHATPQLDQATRDYIRTLERKQDIESIHRAVLDGQTAWFEILTSVMIGLFGILITAIVIFFSLRTKDAAVAEAKLGVSDIRKEVEQVREEIRAMAEQGRAHFDEIRSISAEAADIINGLKAGEIPTSPGERDTVAAAAQIAREKPPGERTVDDLKAMMIASFIGKDWIQMRDHAHAMLYLHGADAEAVSTGLFNLAFAYAELDRSEDAIATYDELIGRFGERSETVLREEVAMALFNKGIRFGKLDRSLDEIATYDDLIVRFDESGEPMLREAVAKALINKGTTLSKLKRSQDAIATFDEILARFDDEPALREQVIRALFNKACAFALGNHADEAVVTLRAWRDKSGGFDCAKVANDHDFDAIRDRPVFVALMEEMGCAAEPRP